MPHLNYANVVATLALVIAVSGGTALAVSGKIGSKKLKKNAVTMKKISAGAVTTDKIANFAVSSDKLVTGAVSESKLVAFQRVTATGPLGGATARCPRGSRLVSGGGSATGGGGPLIASYPDSQEWIVSDGAGNPVVAYAICMA